MGAIRFDEAGSAVRIAKGDEVLAHDTQADRCAIRAGKLRREGNGEPEAAKELSHGSATVRVRDQLVVFF